MAKSTKKTDQGKSWDRRTSVEKAYRLGSRSVYHKRFLIVCEGKNTEPAYFQSFPVQTAEVKSFGIGRSKVSLVKYVIDLVKQESHDPDQLWNISYEREGKGMKFCQSLYRRLSDDPNASQENALRFAERLHQSKSDLSPAEQNPCSTVYQLVAELNKYLKK